MRNRCRNFGGVRAFMKTRPALFLHVLGCVLMRGPGRMTQVSVCDWVHVCQIFHFYFILVIDSPFLVKKNNFLSKSPHLIQHPWKVVTDLKAFSESCLPSWSTCTWHVFCYSRLLCVATTWRACWVNKHLGSVYKHTASPQPSHGKSKSSEGKEGLKYLLLPLVQKQSADTVGKQTVGVRLCTQLQKLPVYIGMLVCNHLGPVILKRWSLSLPAVLMNAIILLAELGGSPDPLGSSSP